MYFCPNCNNVFDITKGSSETFSGGNGDDLIPEFDLAMFGGADDFYDKILMKVIDGEKLDAGEINKISLDDLVQSITYKKLKLSQKQYVYNKIQEQLPLSKKKVFNDTEIKSTEKAYFICNNCGYKKPIKKNTLIFSKVASDVAQSYSSSDTINMKYSDILPRTRKYICPNKYCDSHTNFSKREAVFFRTNNTFKVKYICLACDETF